MLPNMNPRMMRQAMKRMGIQQQDIEAHEVVIRCEEQDIVILNPQVAKVNMGGQETFQISGDYEVREKEVEFSQDDIQTIVDQTKISEDEAKTALKKAKGDLAQAIMDVQND
jgi:nascent polypeptide-associated complex subunit alpha